MNAFHRNYPSSTHLKTDFAFFSTQWGFPHFPQHFLYFSPLPQGQGLLRPILSTLIG
jgi:hypothetical protein